MSQKGDEKLIGFCSAPWTDCITYADGALKACDRNVASFGNWQELGLKNAWESPAFQEFREHMRNGRYPDQDCASCHNNGTQRTALSSLVGAFSVHYEFLRKHFGREFPELSAIVPLLALKKRNADSDRILPLYFAALEKRKAEGGEASTNPEFRNAIVKLQVVGEALEDYLKGELKPRRVATFRQSQLQAKCTARCVMCAGKYTGEIVDGPTMDTKYVDEAFAEIEDVTDFWCNGAEYLFYPEWKKIALMLAKEGVKARVSTNGILLTERNIDFLLDNRILGFLTMSLDAATKETMESTRVRVNYDKNMQRIRYLLKKATDQKHYFEFTAAFVMMKRNLHELPRFVRLMKELMPPDCLPLVTVLCQPLENFNVEGYRRYVHKEHHVLLGDAALRGIFEEVREASIETGVGVSFYNQKLEDFLAAGMPFPRYFPRQMDADLFLADVKEKAPFWREEDIDWQRMLDEAGFDRGRFGGVFLRFVWEKLRANGVIAETMQELPPFVKELEKALPAYADHYAGLYAAKFNAEKFEVERDGVKVRGELYVQRPFQPGDLVFSAASGTAGELLEIRGGLALLHDGRIVPTARGELFHAESVTRNGEPAPPVPNPGKAAMGRVYLWLHERKEKWLGGRKSPLLWKLSVAYREILGAFGVQATPVTMRTKKSA